MSIAQTILDQLGGNQFRMMTGANSFVVTYQGLSVRFPGAKDGINGLTVTLSDDDTYVMDFTRERKSKGVAKVTIVKHLEGIYCDMLQEIFRDTTGLETRMPRIIGVMQNTGMRRHDDL